MSLSPSLQAASQAEMRFTPDNGLVLKWQGLDLIRTSTLIAHAPDWSKASVLRQLAGPVEVRAADGGQLITVSSAPDSPLWFTLKYELTADNRLTVDLDYRLTSENPMALEFSLGHWSAPALMGAKYRAISEDGKEAPGVVPVIPKQSERLEGPHLIPSFRSLSLEGRIGRMTVAIEGDPKALIIFDGRRSPNWQRGFPMYWIGFDVPLKTGEQRHCRITVTLSPPAHPATAVPAPKETKVKRPVTVAQARVPLSEACEIIPEPVSAKCRGDSFPFTSETVIVLPDEATERDLNAARELTDEVSTVYGKQVEVRRSREVRRKTNMIAIGDPSRFPKLKTWLQEAGLLEEWQSLPAEGYVLEVTAGHILAAGRDERGTFYAVQSLIQLLNTDERGRLRAKGTLVRDYPAMPFRGLHLLADDHSLEFHGNLIERVLSRCKINQIVLECEYGKWDHGPQPAMPWAMTKEDMRKLVEIADQHFIEVTPLIQSFGHGEWMLRGDLLKLAEDPSKPYSYCPSKPEVYDFLFPILDEAVEVFKPQYLHIGHDEVNMRGVIPNDDACQAKGLRRMFTEDVKAIHDHLATKGVKVMMWGDMLLNRGECGDAAHGSQDDCYLSRTDLPRDILITDWHYGAFDAYPSVRIFRELGYLVAGSTWYTPYNIYNFAKALPGSGGMGLLQTTWTGYNGNATALQLQPEQISAYVLAAEYAWHPGGHPPEELPYRAIERLNLFLYPPPRTRIESGFTVDLSPVGNVALSGPWLGYGEGLDLSSLPRGTVRVGNTLFQVGEQAVLLSGTMNPPGRYPQSIVIPIGRRARSLIFLLATGWRVGDGTKVGELAVSYRSGGGQTADLTYHNNLASWLDDRTPGNAWVTWSGALPAGGKAHLRAWEWVNPNPEETISQIELSTANTAAGPIVVGITGLQ